jgi:4'-phosphopantetheinyl transferase
MSVVKCNLIDHVFWNTPSAAAFSLVTNVQVWRLQISAHLSLTSEIMSMLDDEERERASSYQREADRQRFILCHWTLRTLLAKYLDFEPNDIVFALGENKKPYVKASGPVNVHFNISHAGDWILITVSGSPVGIDVEYVDRQFDYSEVVPACFSYEDIGFIENSPNPRAGFYLYWTRKESLIKATGRGIDNDLPSVPCLDGVHHLDSNILGQGRDWQVSSFAVDDDHIASVARNPLTQQVLFWDAHSVLQG